MTDATTKNAYGVVTEHRTVIDGQTYTTHLYGADVGFEHLPMLLEVASSPLGLSLEAVLAVVREVKEGEVPSTFTGEQMRMACVHLAQALVNAGGTSRAKDLLSHTKTLRKGDVVRVSDDFAACFQGRYIHMFKVLGWVLEVNYAPFLRDAWPWILSRLASVKRDWQGVLNSSPAEQDSEDGDSPSTASPMPSE